MKREKTDEQKLATAIHKKLCHSNHVDGCGWEYDIDTHGNHNWNERNHLSQNYLRIARQVLSVASFDTAMKVIQAL